MTPSGKVTFLFTDIEGSTKLAQEFPETLPHALTKHHSILTKAIESNNGIVFKIIGDAFCCAFQNAADAVKAAVEIQIDLSKENWGDAVIKIRIGIHSGNAEWNGSDYIGYITLARVARVMSAAYGEQILISNDTYELFFHHKDTKTQRENESDSLFRLRRISDLVVKNVCFKDLGERRLKDVIEPIRLFQVIAKGLCEDFPPIKTLDARPNNLPIQLTNFIGREDEIKYAKKLLKENRLLTLTGTGGLGKTRFSLQTGADLIDDFANGVWFVELAAESESESLPALIISVLDLKEDQNITPEETLTDHLKDRELLIILDNCEHIVESCAELIEKMLLSCPGLKVIATSREALKITGEQIYKIPPLTQPDPNRNYTPEQLTQFESVRLFLERAIEVNPRFRIDNQNAHALAGICSRLDGVPLAIELAAARTKILKLEKIYEGLENRFKLLTGGKRTALPRQQTLRALIDWSFDLLNENEKLLWIRLSIFSGGWTLEAAELICSDEKVQKEEILDLLSQLEEKSIIIYDENKDRYTILETLKQYGTEKLNASDEEIHQKNKHLKYYTELSDSAESISFESEMQIWLEKLESEHGNFQTAIRWAVNKGSKEEGAKLAGNLGRFWEIRGYNSIGIRLLESLIANDRDISNFAFSKILLSIGILARNLGDFERAQEALSDSLRRYKEIDYKYGIVSSLNNLGITESDQGNFEQARNYLEEGINIGREIGNKSEIAISLINLGTISYHKGEYEQAQEYFEESLKLRREIGFKQGIAMCLNNLGALANRKEDLNHAKKLYEESLILGREIGDKTGIAMCLNNLGGLESNQGNYEQSLDFYLESLAIMREQDDKLGIIMSLNNLGILECSNSNYMHAKKLFEESIMLSRDIKDKIGMVQSLIGYSAVLNDSNELSTSVTLLGAVDTALKSTGLILQASKLKFLEQTVMAIKDKQSDKEFEKYFEEGKEMTLEEASQLVVGS